MYKLIFAKRALKELKSMDPHISSLIIGWLEKNIDGTNNPRKRGKALVGDKNNIWRYRIGDYRALCEIVDNEVIVYALKIGHRKEIYK